MSPESLWIKIPEIIGIPLVALFIISFIKAATSPTQWGNENAVEIGMDLSILAAAACGSIFADDTLTRSGVLLSTSTESLRCFCARICSDPGPGQAVAQQAPGECRQGDLANDVRRAPHLGWWQPCWFWAIL